VTSNVKGQIERMTCRR